MTVLRQLEAARVYAPPCLLSKFASQNSDPFLCAGNRKPEYRKQKLGPLAFLHRKRKWWRYCTWHCTWKYQIWRQNRNRIWNRGRFSPIGPETEMVAPLDQLYHVTGNRIEGALLPNTRSTTHLYLLVVNGGRNQSLTYLIRTVVKRYCSPCPVRPKCASPIGS